MTILALDLGTKTGWAVNDNGVIRSGMEDFTPKKKTKKRKADHIGKRCFDFGVWLMKMLNDPLIKIDTIYYEMPHMRGRRATEVLHGFLTYVQVFSYSGGLHNPIMVHSATLKKFATGYGKATKEQMIASAIRYVEPARIIYDDNEADAICLLKYAESQFNA